MAIALKQGTNGNLARFLSGDALEVQAVEPRNTGANLVIGATLTSGFRVVLGHATNADAQVLKDLILDGSLVGGAGTGTLGSSVTDYFTSVWITKAGAQPANAAYALNAVGTNAGAYGIGIDNSTLANVSTATNLQDGLEELDSAISAASGDQDTRPIQDGVTLAPGDAVAVSLTTSGRVAAANADSSNQNPDFVGICITGGTGDAGGTVNCTYKLIGQKATVSGASYTVGQAVFLPVLATATDGEPPEGAPTGTGQLWMRVGWAIQATEIMIAPSTGVIL